MLKKVVGINPWGIPFEIEFDDAETDGLTVLSQWAEGRFSPDDIEWAVVDPDEDPLIADPGDVPLDWDDDFPMWLEYDDDGQHTPQEDWYAEDW